MSDDFEKIGHTEPAPTEGMVTRTIRQQAERIEKLESVLRDVVVTLNSEEIPYMVRNRYACAVAEEVLENDK